MKVSNIKIAIKNSLTLSLTLLIHEMIQIGVISVVSTIKRIEIPSTPSLNLIKSFIHDCSSKNWKSADVTSIEYQTNKESINVAKLLNKEI